jgi:Caspase domain
VTRAIANRLIGVQPVGADTLIAYAAKAGSVSYDGAGSNSPFTTALVKYLAEPGLDIRIALGKVRDEVLTSTNNRQEPFVYGSLGGADISLVPPAPTPKVDPPPIVVDPNVSAANDYQLAERVGARKAWESFLTLHPTGFYADLARAQLAKLTTAQPTQSPDAVKDAMEAKAQADRLAAVKQAADQRAQEEAARQKAQKEASLQPRVDVAPAPVAITPAPVAIAPAPAPVAPQLTQAQACKRDADRLARLRADPSAEQVRQFARELGCEDLRPQIQRLAESLGAELDVNTQAASLTPPTAPASQSKGVVQNKPATRTPTPADNVQTCKRDGDELARIRANPDREAALRFTKELKCEDLRAQAARLLESLD